jgi:hypothetical protein
MHTHRFRAALAAAAILLPLRAEAEVAARVPGPPPTPAYVVVELLLAEREPLSLSGSQVAELTRLAERLRADHGRPKLVGLDRILGKSVPRYTRVFPTAEEALRSALDLLTPEQRAEAARLLQGPERRRTSAERREGDGNRG